MSIYGQVRHIWYDSLVIHAIFTRERCANVRHSKIAVLEVGVRSPALIKNSSKSSRISQETQIKVKYFWRLR